MLNKALGLLKRKKREDSEERNEVTTGNTADKGNVFSRAFKKIKRRIMHAYHGPNVAAICVERTPHQSQATRQYTITPVPNKQVTMDVQRRYYKINEFLPITESRKYEFKTGGGQYPIQILPDHIRKYGTGFLNCDGGVLMAGILDNGAVQGIFCDRKMEDRICYTLDREVSNFYPKVDSQLYNIRFVPVIDGRCGTIPHLKVVEITFKAGDPLSVYESGDHKVFLRREGSVEGPLSPLQIRDIVRTKYRKVLEERMGLDKTLLSP